MTADELEMIAGLCREHDVIVVSDEVYEWLIYPPQQHIRIGQYSALFVSRSYPLHKANSVLLFVCYSVCPSLSVCLLSVHFQKGKR